MRVYNVLKRTRYDTQWLHVFVCKTINIVEWHWNMFFFAVRYSGLLDGRTTHVLRPSLRRREHTSRTGHVQIPRYITQINVPYLHSQLTSLPLPSYQKSFSGYWFVTHDITLIENVRPVGLVMRSTNITQVWIVHCCIWNEWIHWSCSW